MHRIICLSLLSMTLALPAYAGQTIINETETGITVEYKPDAEDSKAAVTMKEQEEKASVVEQAKQARIEEKLAKQRSRNPKNEDGSDAE